MIDIEGIKKRLVSAKQWAANLADPKALADDVESLLFALESTKLVCAGLIETKNAAMGILGFRYGAINDCALEVHKALGLPENVNVIDGVKLVIDSRDNAKRERNELLARCDDVIRESMATKADLDELRTRHARLIDSTDTFVAALVDERFKKDHAAMLAELHTLRTKDTEASKRLRIEINAMPDKTRAVFEHARIDAKVHGVSIMRELIDMVVNVRATASIECDRLRDECRKHLARINVLESEKRILDEAADVLDKSNAPPGLLVDRIEWLAKRAKYSTCVDGVHWVRDGEQIRCVTNGTTLPANVSTGQDVSKGVGKANDAPSANVVPADVIQRAANWATSRETGLPPDDKRAKRALAGMMPDHVWYKLVREFVKLWCEGQAPDEPRKSSLHGEPMCTCPPTSEYDNPCPRHGIVGMEFSKYPDVP